jgi:hypothetical protein
MILELYLPFVRMIPRKHFFFGSALATTMSDQKRPFPELVSIESFSSNLEFSNDKDGEKGSPLSSVSPQSSFSPQSLHTKPWPARPQTLHKGLDGWRWWDSTVDSVMVMLPVPFIILIVAVLVVNGKEVDEYELGILNHAIKGVSFFTPPEERKY